MDNKYKFYISCSGKDGHVAILYLIGGKSGEFGVKKAELIRESSADQSVALVEILEFIRKQSGEGRDEGGDKSRSELNGVKSSGEIRGRE